MAKQLKITLELSWLVKLLCHYLTPTMCTYILPCKCEYRPHPALCQQKHQSVLCFCKKWGGHGLLPFWTPCIFPGKLRTTNYHYVSFLWVSPVYKSGTSQYVAVFQLEHRMENKFTFNGIRLTVATLMGYTNLDELHRSPKTNNFLQSGCRSPYVCGSLSLSTVCRL